MNALIEEIPTMSEDLSTILDSAPEQVATGFVFTEGPLWHPDGFLYFVDVRRSLLFRWSPERGVEMVRENTGEGNGLTFDRQGRLIMCEGGNRAFFDEESKRIDEVIRTSEARYRIVMEAATEAIITIDEESRIVFINQAADAALSRAKTEGQDCVVVGVEP
jgi:sugar lactone lactonase YvrE